MVSLQLKTWPSALGRKFGAIGTWFKQDRFRIHVFFSVLITFISLLLAVVLAVTLGVGSVKYDVLIQSNASYQISFNTQFNSIDASSGTMSIDWSINANSITCNQSEAIINVFFDPNLIESSGNSSPISSLDPPTVPIFQANTTKLCNPGIQDSSPFFSTTSKLIAVGRKWNLNNTSSAISLQWYPFDKYLAVIFLYAQLNNSTKGVVITDSSPSGAPVNFNVDSDGCSSSDPTALLLCFKISRSRAVRTLVLFIVMANWLVTIAFLWLTVAVLVWPERNVGREMFVVPIATLFAFTSVRMNMPGAPEGFGTYIDFFGILPNIALMTLSSATLLFAVLHRRTRRFGGPTALESNRPGKQSHSNSTDKDEKMPDHLQLTNSPDTASINPKPNDNEVLHAILDILKERLLPGHGLVSLPIANMPLATPDSASTAVQIMPISSAPLVSNEPSAPPNLNVSSTVSDDVPRPTVEDDVGAIRYADGLDHNQSVRGRYSPTRMPSH